MTLKALLLSVVICLGISFAPKCQAQSQPQPQPDPTVITFNTVWVSGDSRVTLEKFLSIWARYVGPSAGSTKIEVKLVNGHFGHTALKQVMDSPKDGKTLYFGSTPDLIFRLLHNTELPALWDETEVIDLISFHPIVCIVNRDSKFKSTQEIIAALRKDPESVRFVPGTKLGNLFPLMLMQKLAIPPTSLRFEIQKKKSLVEILKQFPNGYACSTFGSVLNELRDKTFIPIFTTAVTKSSEFPNIPLASEIGLKSMESFRFWTMLIAPKGTPKAIIKRYRDAVQKANLDPEWQEYLRKTNSISAINKVPNLQRFLNEELAFFEKLAVLARFIHD